jgi:hypothetical protein
MAASVKSTSTNKVQVGMRVAPPVLAMVDDLAGWLNAPSKAWVWEAAIIRWHTEERIRRQPNSELCNGCGQRFDRRDLRQDDRALWFCFECRDYGFWRESGAPDWD